MPALLQLTVYIFAGTGYVRRGFFYIRTLNPLRSGDTEFSTQGSYER